MRRMDSYKRNVIKAGQIIESGKSVPLSGAVKNAVPAAGRGRQPGRPDAAGARADETKTVQMTQGELARREQEAYQRGHADGSKIQSKEIDSKVEVLLATLKALPEIRKDILEKGEEQILKLAFAIAEKIIHQEVTTRKDVIVGVLKEALKNVADTEGIKIHLHPGWYTADQCHILINGFVYYLIQFCFPIFDTICFIRWHLVSTKVFWHMMIHYPTEPAGRDSAYSFQFRRT